MENMLHRFLLVCGGDYQQAVLLNYLYYEAYEHVGENGIHENMIDLDIIAQKLCIMSSLQAREALLTSFFELSHTIGLVGLLRGTSFGSSHYMVSPRVINQRLAQVEEEEEKIKKHNKRAIKLGHPGTLTIEDWMYTLNMFRWACAYCGERYDVLEHVIPLNFSPSGTTFDNCVPSCTSCNNQKGPYHPDRFPMRVRDEIGGEVDRVRDFLHRWRVQREEIQQAEEHKTSEQWFDAGQPGWIKGRLGGDDSSAVYVQIESPAEQRMRKMGNIAENLPPWLREKLKHAEIDE